jgi:hypothetical protein
VLVLVLDPVAVLPSSEEGLRNESLALVLVLVLDLAAGRRPEDEHENEDEEEKRRAVQISRSLVPAPSQYAIGIRPTLPPQESSCIPSQSRQLKDSTNYEFG